MKPRNLLRCVFSLLIALPPLVAQAKWLEAGDKIELSGDDGLALFLVDSDSEVSKVRIDRIGSVFSFPELKKLGPGRHLRLLRLPAGEYKFDSMHMRFGDIFEYYWNIDDIPNSRFRVEAGKLNYVGHIVSRGGNYRSITIRDLGLEALESLDKDYPGLSQRFELRYSGDFPDPFLGFLKEQNKKYAASKNMVGPTLPQPSLVQRDLAEILFRQFEVQGAALSPSGKWVVEYAKDGSSKVARLIDLASGTTQSLYSGPRQLLDLEWISDKRLLFTYWDGAFKSVVVDLKEAGEHKITPIEHAGHVLGMLPEGNGQAIFAKPGDSGWSLYRVDMNGDAEKFKFNRKNELRTDVHDDIAWFMDTKGVPRIAELKDKENSVYLYFSEDGASHRFEIAVKANETFRFAGFDPADRLLVLTNRDRNQVELVVFDPLREQLGATRYRVPGVDISGVTLGSNREVVGASYVIAGQLRNEFFEVEGQSLAQSLRAVLPALSVSVDSESSNGKRMVRTFGPTDPGSFFVLDEKSRKLDLFSSVAPHLEGRPMLGTRRVLARAADGFEIESFLTREKSDRSLPLLVIPHGGPVGVFDMKRFDPEVQYFAQLGYAVLQVNYRGSGNAGTAAQKAGFGQWGRGIEGDINAAVDMVLKAGGIDASKIVALGASYGGYSAIMLGVKWPERYKAAVSIAGVTDIPLQFSSGDATHSRKIVEQLVEQIGDPRKELDALVQASPVYRFADIQRPLLLVHDRGDQRVTYEHARRLQKLLTLRDKPAFVISVNDGEHGLVNQASSVANYPKIAAFLEQALALPIVTRTDR